MARTGAAIATCKCGKAAYDSRANAKAARQRLSVKDRRHLRPYLCQLGTGYYHLGNLHESIIAGVNGRDVYSMDDLERWARQAVATRAHGMCEVCGGRGAEYSHRQTRSVEAHRWCPCNAVLACRTCHGRMHASPMMARSEGLHVSRYASQPAQIPIRLSVGWALLDCGGGGQVLKDEEVVVEHGIPTFVGPTQ